MGEEKEMRRTARRLDQAYEKALCIPIGMGSRIVLIDRKSVV